MSRCPCSTLQLHIGHQLPILLMVAPHELYWVNIHSGPTPRGRAGSDAASAVLASIGSIKARDDTCFLPIFSLVEAIEVLKLPEMPHRRCPRVQHGGQSDTARALVIPSPFGPLRSYLHTRTPQSRNTGRMSILFVYILFRASYR
jgi:hypothetical protein